jgi:hypothetical protein
MELVNAFSIPIYKFKFADHKRLKKEMMEYLLDPAVFEENTIRGRGLQFTAPNLHLMDLYKPIAEFMHTNVNLVMNDLGFVPQTQMTGMWATCQQDNSGHHRHSHGNSFLAGVYYLHGNLSHAGTTFHFPYNHTHIVPAKNGQPLKLAKTYTTWFEEGTLYIFPAWLEHGTGLNNVARTGSERYILSFNTMPIGQTNHDVFDRYNYVDTPHEDMIQSRKKTIPGI